MCFCIVFALWIVVCVQCGLCILLMFVCGVVWVLCLFSIVCVSRVLFVLWFSKLYVVLCV